MKISLKNFKGSCLCKKVKFSITGFLDSFYLCHCKRCQKDTGSAHAANLFSTTAKVNWTSGEDNIQSFVLPNTMHTKSFCKTCGSALPNLQMDGRLLVVPAGSLDNNISAKPNAHIFWKNRATWDANLESYKKLDGSPSS